MRSANEHAATSTAPAQQPVDVGALREQVRLDVEAALQRAQVATQAQREAAQSQGAAAPEVVDVPPLGKEFRIVDGDRTVLVGPEGVTVQPTPEPFFPPPPLIPPEAVIISIAFFVLVAFLIVGLPIARAIARRMDRREAAGARPLPEQAEQLLRIEQAVDAMAVEVERISEGQRFVTRLLAERSDPDAAGDRRLAGARPLPEGTERR